MSVILLLIPLSVVIAAAFLAAFIWAVRSGQFEDTCTPSMRLLIDERQPRESAKSKNLLRTKNER
jgi:cbb3-type cytochrome oxidase maturation protein